MATKFLDYTGLSYLWSKIKEWCSSIFVTKATDENVTGTKTFVGSKKIAFKQSGTNDKLGFTLYNNSSKEQGYLEYNPTNKIANVPLFTLGNYATAADELTYIGFRRYSNISGASGAYNLLAPLISDAKTPFNLTTTYTNFYLPLGISDGTNIVTTSNSGVVDISSLLSGFLTSTSTLDATKLSGIIPSNCYTNTTYTAGIGLSLSGTEFSLASHNQASDTINAMTGYSKPSSGSAIAASDSLNSAIGKLEAKVDSVDDSNYVHLTGDEDIDGAKSFRSVYLKSEDIVKGTNPSAKVYRGLAFVDNNFDPANAYYAHRLGILEYALGTNGVSNIAISAYKNSANSTNTAGIYVYYDTANDLAYAMAPSTLASRSEGTDIVTRDWIDQDDRIVRTSGDQTIRGVKTFTGDMVIVNNAPYLYIRQNDVERGVAPENAYSAVYFHDKNKKAYGGVISRFYGGLNGAVEIVGWDVTSNSSTGACNLRVMYHGTSIGKIVEPDSNGDVLLGRSSHRFKEIWCTQSSINSSSDERDKTFIASIPNDILDAWEDISWLQFKFNEAVSEKGDKARFHTGTVAQYVDRVFKEKQLDITKYGLFLYDKWEAEEEADYDENGNLRHEASPAGDSYGIRYTEALCMEAAYQRRKNKILENRISELEKQVSDMLILLQNLTNGNG